MNSSLNTSWSNWAGLERSVASAVVCPSSPDEVAAAIRQAREAGLTVKMTGTGHSFNGIALTDGLRIDPSRLRGISEVDRESMTVSVLAGTPLHELNTNLERLGLSLHNMGDIAEQTIAGATATGTHGTGGQVASLSAQIVGLDLVAADGQFVHANADYNSEVFAVARLGLGALGILTTLTLRVEPIFTLEARETPMTWDQVLGSFEELVASNQHFEFYWFPHTEDCLVKQNNRTLAPAKPLPGWRKFVDDDLLANRALGLLNKVGNASPNLIPGMNRVMAKAVTPRTYSDVPHRVFTSERSVRFREMEYAVALPVGLHALRAVRNLIDRSGWQISFPIEVRTAPADNVSLSTAYGRDVMYLAFHVNQQTDHREYFGEVEKVLRGFGGRPHWGKLHTCTAEDLATAYPRFGDFADIRNELDPDRIFTNDYLRRVLGS